MKKFLKIAGAVAGLVLVGLLMLTPFVHAQTIPTVGTTDIASVGGAILAPLITGGEYVMTAFGPPLFYFGLVLLVFGAIWAYVAHRRPRL